MKKPIKKIIDLAEFKDKAYILVIDEDNSLSIKEINEEAVLILPEQLIELVGDKNFMCERLAIQVYLALKRRLDI